MILTREENDSDFGRRPQETGAKHQRRVRESYELSTSASAIDSRLTLSAREEDSDHAARYAELDDTEDAVGDENAARLAVHNV